MKLFAVLSLSAYVVGSIGYLGFAWRNRESWHEAGHIFFLTGLVVQTLLAGVWIFSSGFLPVDDLPTTLFFSAWGLAVIYVIFHFRFRLRILGALVGPLVSLLVLASLAMPATRFARPEILKSAWLFFHVATLFLGNGAFVLAAATGAAYLLQERAIKNKTRGFFFKRLPSLSILDRMGYACVALGFPLLTLGLITGFVYARSVWGRWWSWDPKEVWSVALWLLYAALLHERLAVGWRGRRAAILAIVGFAALVFTFLGVNFLLPGHHGQFTGF